MRKNRHESESHEESEDEGWLMTYADTITTLLGFFIMLVSLSSINMGKFQQATSSVRAKFHSDKSSELETLKNNLDSLMIVSQASTEVDVKIDNLGLRMIASNASFFPSGSDSLLPKGIVIINQIIGQIKSMKAQMNIEVEGHTDDRPISNSQFESNWELSSNRASTVIRYMIARGIAPKRLKATAYAEIMPEVPNRDKLGNPIEANMAKNRRVVIRIFY